MQVTLHLGVHCTDEDRLLKCLLRNADPWRHDGIAVPGPSKYRGILSEAVNSLTDRAPSPEAREVLLDGILAQDPDQVERLVMCHENLFGVPKLMMGAGTFYRKAENRLQTVRQLFAGDDLEFFIGIRNPATFLPAAYSATPHEDFSTFLNGVDPMHLYWSELLERIRYAVPDVPITVWCNEDTPIIWGEIVREMGGIELSRKIIGAFDLLSSIITREGMKRFRGFLKEHPTMNEMQKRRVMAAFLDKYAIDDEVEEELDLPGWDENYIDALTQQYEDDVLRIASMPGVSFISP